MDYKKSSTKTRKISSSELKAFRLEKIIKFLRNHQGQYFSIKRLREAIMNIDKELELEYEHINLTDPTERQVQEIHSEIFSGSKEQAFNLVIKDFFMSPEINLENILSDENIDQLLKLLSGQGIEHSVDTLKKKIREYIKRHNDISIRSEYIKQRTRYRDLLSMIQKGIKEKTLDTEKSIHLLLKTFSQQDRLGVQELGRLRAHEEAIGLEESEMPIFQE